MSNRRRLARERLEIYLVHLLLAYRPLIFISGVLLSFYSIAAMFLDTLAGSICLLPAIYLLTLCGSFKVVLYTARFVSWIATLGRHEN